MLGAKKETAAYQTNSLTHIQGHFIPYENLCKWLKMNDLTQDRLAALTGRTLPTVRKYNAEKLWTIKDVQTIATALRIPFEEAACRLAQIEPQSVPKAVFDELVDETVSKRLQKAIDTLEEVYR